MTKVAAGGKQLLPNRDRTGLISLWRPNEIMFKKYKKQVKGEVKVWFNENMTFKAGPEWSLRCLREYFAFLTENLTAGFYNAEVH